MTKAQLREMPRRTAAELLLALADGPEKQRLLIAVECALNYEWWHGRYAKDSDEAPRQRWSYTLTVEYLLALCTANGFSSVTDAVVRAQKAEQELAKGLSGKMIYAVRCITPGDDHEPVHIFSTPEAAARFCSADHNRMHVRTDYVIDCPERMEQHSN